MALSRLAVGPSAGAVPAGSLLPWRLGGSPKLRAGVSCQKELSFWPNVIGQGRVFMKQPVEWLPWAQSGLLLSPDSHSQLGQHLRGVLRYRGEPCVLPPSRTDKGLAYILQIRLAGNVTLGDFGPSSALTLTSWDPSIYSFCFSFATFCVM